MNVRQKLNEIMTTLIAQATTEEVYHALLRLTQEEAQKKVSKDGKKKLYYISAEFLIGKLLSNNLINLGIYDEVRTYLAENGKDLTDIEEFEKEPSLGNGGLGRLAACFLDSIATLNLNGDGVGLNYHFGLFHQKLTDHLQAVEPDVWRDQRGWLIRTMKSYPVTMAGVTYQSAMYDILVTG
ncbi:MAG: glycogen/starch/alpha-glucan phosphorylase, partial [Lachnospiraceae bacterium]|nr:glycogen/starch/alpha-glucan phosphorylase [Lachnospiraceae bacterium]